MAGLRIRWSEHEARKPYARPFGVTFIAGDGEMLGSVAVGGADLLYHRQFQAAVLALAGEIFHDIRVTAAPDPQRAWLDVLAELLPACPDFAASPVSAFDEQRGRTFHFSIAVDSVVCAAVDAACLLDYQEFQAALAHQTGVLLREPAVEGVDDVNARHAAWMDVLRHRVQRPDDSEAMSAVWPWR